MNSQNTLGCNSGLHIRETRFLPICKQNQANYCSLILIHTLSRQLAYFSCMTPQSSNLPVLLIYLIVSTTITSLTVKKCDFFPSYDNILLFCPWLYLSYIIIYPPGGHAIQRDALSQKICCSFAVHLFSSWGRGKQGQLPQG